MGVDRVTQRNLRVLGVDKTRICCGEGSVPGPTADIWDYQSQKPPRERRGFGARPRWIR